MSIKMQLTEPIFLTSIGLIASGYDLYNKNRLDIVEIIDVIKKEYVDLEVINYFKESRTDTCSVNPYWPRGSAICAASLFLTPDYSNIDLEAYLSFERQSNSSALWQDNEFIQWVKLLPHYLRLIKQHSKTEEIIRLIKKCIGKYEEEFCAELNKANKILEEFKADTKCEVVYMPNLLQADQCTDYIKVKNILYVVATKPRFSSIVHEYLHLCMEPHRELMAEGYKAYEGKELFLKEKLSALGYLWDDGFNSHLRCLEEGFVRGLTILISECNEKEKRNELEELKNEGFLIADKLRSFTTVKVTEEMLGDIISMCISNYIF